MPARSYDVGTGVSVRDIRYYVKANPDFYTRDALKGITDSDIEAAIDDVARLGEYKGLREAASSRDSDTAFDARIDLIESIVNSAIDHSTDTVVKRFRD